MAEPRTATQLLREHEEKAISEEIMNLYKILWVPGYVNDLPQFLLISVPALRRLLPEPLQGGPNG